MNEISWQAIESANNATKPMDIKGNKYIKVSERVKAFRMVYPMGFIESEMITDEKGCCVYKAVCGFYAEDGSKKILGTGVAREQEGTSYINKSSYMENCETSAVGRALGFAGFGIDYEIASQDEMNNKSAEIKSRIMNDIPDDGLKPGEKVTLQQWDPRLERSKWCAENGITQQDFGNIKATIEIKRGSPYPPYNEITPEDFAKMCSDIKSEIQAYLEWKANQ